jgi:hypothetical protein
MAHRLFAALRTISTYTPDGLYRMKRRAKYLYWYEVAAVTENI